MTLYIVCCAERCPVSSVFSERCRLDFSFRQCHFLLAFILLPFARISFAALPLLPSISASIFGFCACRQPARKERHAGAQLSVLREIVFASETKRIRRQLCAGPYFSCACTSQAADSFGGELSGPRETRRKKKEKKKSCSSRAPGGLSAPLPTRAWKPAELITSAPLLVLRGAKEDGKLREEGICSALEGAAGSTSCPHRNSGFPSCPGVIMSALPLTHAVHRASRDNC